MISVISTIFKFIVGMIIMLVLLAIIPTVVIFFLNLVFFGAMITYTIGNYIMVYLVLGMMCFLSVALE